MYKNFQLLFIIKARKVHNYERDARWQDKRKVKERPRNVVITMGKTYSRIVFRKTLTREDTFQYLPSRQKIVKIQVSQGAKFEILGSQG